MCSSLFKMLLTTMYNYVPGVNRTKGSFSSDNLRQVSPNVYYYRKTQATISLPFANYRFHRSAAREQKTEEGGIVFAIIPAANNDVGIIKTSFLPGDGPNYPLPTHLSVRCFLLAHAHATSGSGSTTPRLCDATLEKRLARCLENFCSLKMSLILNSFGTKNFLYLSGKKKGTTTAKQGETYLFLLIPKFWVVAPCVT